MWINYKNFHDENCKNMFSSFKKEGCEYFFDAGFVEYCKFDNIRVDKFANVNYCLIVTLKGNAFFVDENSSVNYSLKTGNFFQCLPQEIYSIEVNAQTGWSIFYLSVPKELFELLSMVNGINTESLVGELSLNNSLINKLVKYVNLVDKTPSERGYELLNEACLLISEFFTSHQNRKNSSELMINVAEYLTENYNKKIDFDYLAKRNSYSYESLRKKFKNYYGVSPQRYLINFRMDKAIELLHNLDYTIKDVSNELGYSTQYKFSEHFKRYFAVSPSQYRKSRLKE
ncbi:AraC family transcriptional regulator [Lentisphaerota bacterium WC36G]|nr:AraC family transcriptional regulator [Lentisphaerae bacterium WC36]